MEQLKNITNFRAAFKKTKKATEYLRNIEGIKGTGHEHTLGELLAYEGVGELQIPGSFLSEVNTNLDLPVTRLTKILDVSKSKYYRILDETELDMTTIDKVSSLMKIYESGLEAFEGSFEEFSDWLYTKISSLSDRCPIDLLETENGRMAVLETIDRIEHNVYG